MELIMIAAAGVLLYLVLIVLFWLAYHKKKIEVKEGKIEILALQNKIENEKALFEIQNSINKEMALQMKDTFSSMSTEALAKNNQMFLDLAKSSFTSFNSTNENFWDKKHQDIASTLQPLKQSLEVFEKKVGDMEKDRINTYSSLSFQIKALNESQLVLQQATNQLSSALQAPMVRGKWGEMQLRRVVEMSGLSNHCDFVCQKTLTSVNGETLRPDMVVKLPSQRSIIIDAKAPVNYYLKASEQKNDDERVKYLRRFAEGVKTQVNLLSSKSYWKQVNDHSAEFVVMFLPNEVFLNVAIEYCPELLEISMNKKVIITTPCTLIALLQVVAFAWKEENISQSVKEIEELGSVMYKRLKDVSKHFSTLGLGIDNVVKSYNGLVGSFSSRVLSTAKKLANLQQNNDNDKLKLEEVESLTRKLP